ncbi:hypothetical protein [Glaciecola sp. 1036]|uniref:hypothetical protein n=1 Tax=Alteromonadaceae TaxID=72275 RepID=UPI003D089FFB
MKRTLSQRSWEWIKHQHTFSSKELASEMDVSLAQAQNAIYHLKTLGAVRSMHRGYKGTVYSKIENAKPFLPGKNATSPRGVCVRQRIWQTIRYLTKFTVNEVIASAECSRASVEKFISDLQKYNYVVSVRQVKVTDPMRKRTGNGHTYLLINNTGRKYPVMSEKGMRDQNLDRLMPLATETRKKA